MTKPKPTQNPASLTPHDIWLAGLSALTQAQAQRQKAVEKIVAQGEALQSQAQEQWSEMTQRVGNPFAAVPSSSGLEGVFEQRVAHALQALGIPSAKDVQALRAEIDALKAQLESLQQATASAPSAKPAVKKAVAKKAAKKSTNKGVASNRRQG